MTLLTAAAEGRAMHNKFEEQESFVSKTKKCNEWQGKSVEELAPNKEIKYLVMSQKNIVDIKKKYYVEFSILLVDFSTLSSSLQLFLSIVPVSDLPCICCCSFKLTGTPKFPKHLLDATAAIDLNLDLVKCIGPCSLLLFHLLGKKDEQLDWLHCRKLGQHYRLSHNRRNCTWIWGGERLHWTWCKSCVRHQRSYTRQRPATLLVASHRTPPKTRANNNKSKFLKFLNYCAQEWIKTIL